MDKPTFQLLNYTPHKIHIYADDGTTVLHELESLGVIRATTTTEDSGVKAFDFPLMNVTFSRPEFPEGFNPPPFSFVIVSYIALQAIKKYAVDYEYGFTFCSPNDLVRDSEGRVLGAKSLAL